MTFIAHALFADNATVQNKLCTPMRMYSGATIVWHNLYNCMCTYTMINTNTLRSFRLSHQRLNILDQSKIICGDVVATHRTSRTNTSLHSTAKSIYTLL